MSTDDATPSIPTSDINTEATRAQCERSSDLRLIPQPGGNFPSATEAVAVLNAVLGAQEWALRETVAYDPCVAECAQALVRWLAARGRLPRTDTAEEHKGLVWGRWRMLFAGLGHAHHHAVVEALEHVNAGCPWKADESEREWSDEVLEARKSSHWPATLLLVPWRDLSAAVSGLDAAGDEGPEYGMWWGEACLMWHLVRHLRRSDRYGLVTTYRGASGATTALEGTSNIANHTSIQPLARALGIHIAASTKDAHPFAGTARDLLTSSSRDRLLPRASLPMLPAAVLAAPTAAYVTDRSRVDLFFQHQLRLTRVWFAEDGHVREAADLELDHAILLGYDWRPIASATTDEELHLRWARRLVATYDAARWPSQILSQGFPNIRWRLPAHQSLFDAVALLSVLRDAHPVLTEEYPLLVLLPMNPVAADSIRNGKSAATRSLVSMFASDAPVTQLGATAGSPDTRSIMVNIREHGTIGLDEFVLPTDGSHPLNAKALATLCTGGTRTCGMVYSNEPMQIHLRHSLVINTKTVSLPSDLESRALFLWLDQLTDEQTADGEAYQAAVSGQLGLRLRLAALALVAQHGAEAWIKGLDAGTTQHGWRFGIHRQVAAACYAQRHDVPYADGIAAIDEAHDAMLKLYREHTDAGDASGLLDMLESGKIHRLTIDQLFDVRPETMGTVVERVRVHSRHPEAMTAGQILHGVLEPYVAANAQASTGIHVAQLTGRRSYEQASKRVLETLIGQDLADKLPEVGQQRMFAGELGLLGWWIKYVGHNSNKSRCYAIGCDNPALESHTLRKRQQPFTKPEPPKAP